MDNTHSYGKCFATQYTHWKRILYTKMNVYFERKLLCIIVSNVLNYCSLKRTFIGTIKYIFNTPQKSVKIKRSSWESSKVSYLQNNIIIKPITLMGKKKQTNKKQKNFIPLFHMFKILLLKIINQWINKKRILSPSMNDFKKTVTNVGNGTSCSIVTHNSFFLTSN